MPISYDTPPSDLRQIGTVILVACMSPKRLSDYGRGFTGLSGNRDGVAYASDPGTRDERGIGKERLRTPPQYRAGRRGSRPDRGGG